MIEFNGLLKKKEKNGKLHHGHNLWKVIHSLLGQKIPILDLCLILFSKHMHRFFFFFRGRVKTGWP